MKKLLALSSLLTLLSSCAPRSPQDTGPVKLGFIGPLTGDIAGLGADLLNGVRMAVEEANARGGVSGRKVELVAEDGRCNGADSASAAQKLVNVDRVHAIVGGACSSETLAAAPITEAGKVVLISAVSSSPDVTQAGDYVFRNYPSDAFKGPALAKLFQRVGLTKLAIIGENTDFCQGVRRSVTDSLLPGTDLVFDEVVDPGTKDFRSLFTRLKEIDFDVLLANAQTDAGIAAMATQMRELGLHQQIVGSDVADSATLGQIAKGAVEGLKLISVPGLDESLPSGQAFAEKVRATFGEPQYGMFFVALAYDATNILLSAVAKAGTEGGALRDAVAAADHDGIAASYSFDQNGDVRGVPFAMKEFIDGKLVQSELIPLE